MKIVTKIAVFRGLYLGDMLCIIPTIRAIRHAYPKAEIFLIGLPWQKDFAKRFQRYFNHFLEFPGWPGLPEQQPDAGEVLRFVEKIRAFNFDIIFQMQGNGDITNSMCMLWGSERVCGLRTTDGYAPDERLFPVSEDGEHEILRFFKLLAALDIEPRGAHLEFPITAQEEQHVRELLDAAGFASSGYVCLHPGARDVRRRWPVENFAFIASHIAAHGIPVVLSGSVEEKDLLRRLQEQIRTPVLNIVESFGHLGAGELAEIIRRSRLLVSNDTGVSHIAAALGTPSIILFSPYSDMRRWHPLDARTHMSIPFEQAMNTEYVLERTVAMLRDNKIDHGQPLHSNQEASTHR